MEEVMNWTSLSTESCCWAKLAMAHTHPSRAVRRNANRIEVLSHFIGRPKGIVATTGRPGFFWWFPHFLLRFSGRIGRCLLYTSDAADDLLCVDLGGRRI